MALLGGLKEIQGRALDGEEAVSVVVARGVMVWLLELEEMYLVAAEK